MGSTLGQQALLFTVATGYSCAVESPVVRRGRTTDPPHPNSPTSEEKSIYNPPTAGTEAIALFEQKKQEYI